MHNKVSIIFVIPIKKGYKSKKKHAFRKIPPLSMLVIHSANRHDHSVLKVRALAFPFSAKSINDFHSVGWNRVHHLIASGAYDQAPFLVRLAFGCLRTC